ncbi:hypothetical protein NRF20_25815 [Streptomyces sp. R-74717]|uniref:hypothetical protein n=1 Tax=Streptomyces sp. R-74717 TaxID=2969820 RepID=UPI0039B43C1C
MPRPSTQPTGCDPSHFSALELAGIPIRLLSLTRSAAGARTRSGPGRPHASPLGQDCADVTAATRRVLTRGNSPDPALLTAQAQACLIACRRSHDLCEQHARQRARCRLCADATGRAADACREVLVVLGS